MYQKQSEKKISVRRISQELEKREPLSRSITSRKIGGRIEKEAEKNESCSDSYDGGDGNAKGTEASGEREAPDVCEQQRRLGGRGGRGRSTVWLLYNRRR